MIFNLRFRRNLIRIPLRKAGGTPVRQVDPLRGRIWVVESVTEVNGVLIFGTPKAHQSRSVPVPGFLREQLAAAMAGKAPDDRLFTSRDGSVLRNGNFRRDVFDRAARSVDLAGFTPHELKHTAASLAITAGASVKAVQRMLGHASATLTLDRYGHLFGDELDSVADRLDQHRADFSRTPRGLATVTPLAVEDQ
jgi:integrase